MLKTIKARYTKGRIEPTEPLSLDEGAEVTVTIALSTPAEDAADPTGDTAGSWEPLLNCEQFEADVYQSRLLATRPDVKL